MEAAQCSAKKKILDESGSLLVALGFVLLITGAIGYFMSIADKVDKQVRSLGATQKTAYLKTDLQSTIRKTLMGENSECPSAKSDELRLKFKNFLATIDQAKYEFRWTYSPGSPIGNAAEAKCYFHPARYTGVDFQNVTVELVRASEPNFISLSSFVTASVNIGIKSGDAKSQQKYSLRYRVEVLTMNLFGIIFDHTNKLFNIEDDAKVFVNSRALVDQPDRKNPLPLSNFLIIPDHQKLRFNQSFWMAAPKLSTNFDSLEYLNNKKLNDNFAYGIEYDVLPYAKNAGDPPQPIAPYRERIGERWNELFNYDVMDVIYPMPNHPVGGITAIWSPSTSAVIYQYDKKKDNVTNMTDNERTNTAGIYQSMLGNKNMLFKSCAASDYGRGQFNLLIFNNLTKDFVLDFSDNTTLSTPPVFCGLIAANNLTIILNDKTTDDLKQNHFIGKIIVKNTITVKKKGVLHLHDIMTVTNEVVPYALEDLSNLKFQYYNQKYFSSQNFQLPYFQNTGLYSQGLDSDAGHYIPRHTGHFFDKLCDGKYCRRDEIGVPDEKKLIVDHQNNLLFEVFNVE